MTTTRDEVNWTLLQVPPGGCVRMRGFMGMSSEHRQHLRGYGLTPGCTIEVVQHSPVTVIKVDETELALDKELARQVEISLPIRFKRGFHPGREPRQEWFGNLRGPGRHHRRKPGWMRWHRRRRWKKR